MKRNPIKMLGVLTLLATLLLLLLPTEVAQANGITPIPHAFYGDLRTTAGGLAPVGVVVSAKVNRVIACEPLTTTVAGKYGDARPGEPKLIVGGFISGDPKLVFIGDIQDGTPIEFYVNDVLATPLAKFYSGEVTKLDLTYTPPAPPSSEPSTGGGDGGPPSTETLVVQLNIGGVQSSHAISSTGKLLETIEAVSQDSKLKLILPENTIAQNKMGQPLTNLSVNSNQAPPPPPEDTTIVGLAYNLEPSGARFDPPIIISLKYDPSSIPQGVSEVDLKLAYYDEATGKWVVLESTVDTVSHALTARVSHFTTFAIVGSIRLQPSPPALPSSSVPPAFTAGSLSISPAAVGVGGTVTISLVVSNTGGSGSYIATLKVNGLVEAMSEISVAAGASQEVIFTTSKNAAGSYSVDVNGLIGSFNVVEKAAAPTPPPTQAKPSINWPLIGGVTAAIIILGLLTFFLIVRRRGY